MKKQQYLTDEDVANFVAWASGYILIWQKSHYVLPSRFSKGGHFKITGIQEAYELYEWRSHWQNPETNERIESSNAADTESSLDLLSSKLLCTLNDRNSDLHCKYCHQVLEWGGVPKSCGFYDKLNRENRLIKYHSDLHIVDNAILNPDTADDACLKGILKMSSGITKVHCLLSKARLPIMDTRFAAALAELIAIWCVKNKKLSVPKSLLFGCGSARGGQRRVPIEPSEQKYPTLCSLDKWMQRQVHACWLVEAILDKAQCVFAGLEMEKRINRFAMGCFMIGYNLQDDENIVENLSDLKDGGCLSDDDIYETAYLEEYQYNSSKSVIPQLCSHINRQNKLVEHIKATLFSQSNQISIETQKSPFTAKLLDEGISVSNLGTSTLLPWEVFGAVIELLGKMESHQAAKGDAMNGKLGDERLPLDSVEGYIASEVYGKQKGSIVFRRITPVVKILVKAGVVSEGRGWIKLKN